MLKCFLQHGKNFSRKFQVQQDKMLKSKDFMHNSGNRTCGIISFYDLTENA